MFSIVDPDYVLYCWSSPALVVYSVLELNGTRIRVCEAGNLHLLRSSEWDVGDLRQLVSSESLD